MKPVNIALLYGGMALLLVAVGLGQSWDVSLGILNLCIISAIMALGVNMQWGYAGLFNSGIMGFAAVGGIAAIVVAQPPTLGAWSLGGVGIGLAFLVAAASVAAALIARKVLPRGLKTPATVLFLLVGYFGASYFFEPATKAIESYDAATTGYLGGLGLPVLLSWLVGAVFAAAVAWGIGKVALGLRPDYFSIATLGIAEIILVFIKNEVWLTRGVNNVTNLPRPIPTVLEFASFPWVIDLAGRLGTEPVALASIISKLCFTLLFTSVLAVLLLLAETALNSPWGRMMRAIRDNETAAKAMGKNVKARHLQIFILGSAVAGMAGAMLVTLDGQFTPGSYNPLRYTFLIWVMVIVGGSGNNWGSVLGAFLIWFVWIESEPFGNWLVQTATENMAPDSDLRQKLLDSASYMRVILMGTILLVTLRFRPRGLIPERHAIRSRH